MPMSIKQRNQMRDYYAGLPKKDLKKERYRGCLNVYLSNFFNYILRRDV